LAAMHPVDGAVLVVYLIGMLLLGFYFAGRSKNTQQYFVASRSYKGWVIGVSMMSTTISSVTFLAFPAGAYALDWRMVVTYLVWPLGAILAVFFFVSFFRRGLATTAFEYLDDRFGPLASLYGAVIFIIQQLLRISVVLYLVSLAIGSLTGLPMVWVIIIAGLVIGCYTVAGGIEGVIWTDVIQAFLLWAGGILCMILIVVKIPGGVNQILEVGAANGKFHLGDMEWDLGRRTFWTMIMLGAWASVGNFCTDQHVVQRYIAAESTREAKKGALVGAVLSVPTWLFFFSIGTALWVYYHLNPDPQVANMEADGVFPYFILNNVPVGLSGCIIAAVVAAAMSSLDSSINAVSTVSVTNIMRKYLFPGRGDSFYLRSARIIGTICVIIMILGALGIRVLPNKESMMNLQYIIFALIGGCVPSIFLLGFLTRRVHYAAIMISLVFAILLNVFLILDSAGLLPEAVQVGVHEYWVNILVNIFFVVVAYAMSAFWGRRQKSLQGLTVWTICPASNRIACSSSIERKCSPDRPEHVPQVKREH